MGVNITAAAVKESKFMLRIAGLIPCLGGIEEKTRGCLFRRISKVVETTKTAKTNCACPQIHKSREKPALAIFPQIVAQKGAETDSNRGRGSQPFRHGRNVQEE